jgi:extradiol dioxygenase family protein
VAHKAIQQTLTHCCWPVEDVTRTRRHFGGRVGMKVPRMLRLESTIHVARRPFRAPW